MENPEALAQPVHVREFYSRRDYEAWLARCGASIRIMDVATTKRWSLLTGFLGDAKTYTVTFRAESGAAMEQRLEESTTNPGAYLFIGVVVMVLLIVILLTM